jgi:hypothetical protein
MEDLLGYRADFSLELNGRIEPLEACCFDNGTCEVLIEEACHRQGGDWAEEGIPCNPDPCPPSSACCVPGGGCGQLTEDACNRAGGKFLLGGMASPVSPTLARPLPARAVCGMVIASCSTWDGCTLYQGFWQGADAACDPNLCQVPQEACCYPNQTCYLYPPDHCILTGGTPQGAGTTCETAACKAPPYGACCLATGWCEVMFEAQCQALGGVYYDAIPCDPVPCQTPVRATTWGRIRGDFR